MKKLKKLLNPLNIPYQYQDDILSMIDGDRLSMLIEDDYIEALELGSEVMTLKLNNLDLTSESLLNQNIKNELIRAKAIIIVFETLDDELPEKYKIFIEYVYSFTDDNTIVKFDLKIVEQLSIDPITILLTGYKNNEQFILETGNDFAEYWTNNIDYCFEEFKKMRENISKQISQPINGIQISSTSRSSNMVELSDTQTLQALRVFEFNEQTKEEFDKFTTKLEPILLKYSLKSI